MRHVITFALLATVLMVAQAHPGMMMMNKECWENKPTAVSDSYCGRESDLNANFVSFSSSETHGLLQRINHAAGSCAGGVQQIVSR